LQEAEESFAIILSCS